MANGKTPINHIAMIVDRSGSMARIMTNVVKVFNNQLVTIKENAKKDDQDTFVTFYTFHSRVDKPIYSKRPAKAVRPIKKIRTAGSTALFDAVGTAMEDLDKARDVKLDHVSCLVIVLTDGHENASRTYRKKLPKMIEKAQKTGRWSFAFLTPKSGVGTLKKFGIPPGNIQDWDASSKGTKEVDLKLRHGLDGFFDARRSGKKSVAGFFRADLAKVNAKDVAGRLKDVSNEFKRWSVDVGGAAIRAFVDKKLGAGSYKPGNGYYELTKSELVQAKKEIAIRDNKTGAVFTGSAARSMLGFPDGTSFKVKPGEMGNYSVFIMSTSLNRVLAKGTTLLYRA
ncbi:MAG TPA: vWA domain-containing protein [Kofleriaceae bacterium]|nr:vWA domain-containing protein [Kofleriaceae bacterium]